MILLLFLLLRASPIPQFLETKGDHSFNTNQRQSYMTFEDSDSETPLEYNLFARRVSKNDSVVGIKLLHTLDKIFQEHNVTWTLMFGTLAGQQYFHNLIPWDDDWDILVFEEKRFIEDILEGFCQQNPEFGYYNGSFLKIFLNESPHAGSYPWKWPFVDIFVEEVNLKEREIEKIIWAPGVKVEDVFPLQRGFFGGALFPIPNHPDAVMSDLFDGEFGKICRTGYDHKREELGLTDVLPCESLWEYYAKIDRWKFDSASYKLELETLRRCEETFHTVAIFTNKTSGAQSFFLFGNDSKGKSINGTSW